MKERKFPLSKEILSLRESAVNVLSGYDNIIESRIDYILTCIAKVFEFKIDTWYFPDAAEGTIGDFDRAEYDDYIYIVVEVERTLKDDCVILINNEPIDLIEGIPKSWLFEDFEDELTNGRKAYLKFLEDKTKKNKERYAKKKIEKKKILDSIKGKLSSEELKHLKGVLK
jgi:hypothetical protein